MYDEPTFGPSTEFFNSHTYALLTQIFPFHQIYLAS